MLIPIPIPRRATSQHPSSLFCCLFSIAYLSQLAPLVSAASRNVTVDDADPSVVYSNSPPDLWNNQVCSVCSAVPSNANANGGTWHDGTHHAENPPLTASLTFTGTGIYVFGITSGIPEISNQNLQFSIDSQHMSTFQYSPNSLDYNYNVLFFSHSGLLPGSHTIEMTVVDNSWVLLDYFIVTVQENDPPAPVVSPSPQTQTVNPPLPSQTSKLSQSTINGSVTSGSATLVTSPTSQPSHTASTSNSAAIPSASSANVAAPLTISSPPSSDSAAVKSKSSNAGPIAGAVIGFAFIMAGLFFLVKSIRKRRKTQDLRALANPPLVIRQRQEPEMVPVNYAASLEVGEAVERSTNPPSSTSSNQDRSRASLVDPFIVGESPVGYGTDRKGRWRASPQVPGNANRGRGTTATETIITDGPPAYTFS